MGLSCSTGYSHYKMHGAVGGFGSWILGNLILIAYLKDKYQYQRPGNINILETILNTGSALQWMEPFAEPSVSAPSKWHTVQCLIISAIQYGTEITLPHTDLPEITHSNLDLPYIYPGMLNQNTSSVRVFALCHPPITRIKRPKHVHCNVIAGNGRFSTTDQDRSIINLRAQTLKDVISGGLSRMSCCSIMEIADCRLEDPIISESEDIRGMALRGKRSSMMTLSKTSQAQCQKMFKGELSLQRESVTKQIFINQETYQTSKQRLTMNSPSNSQEWALRESAWYFKHGIPSGDWHLDPMINPFHILLVSYDPWSGVYGSTQCAVCIQIMPNIRHNNIIKEICLSSLNL